MSAVATAYKVHVRLGAAEFMAEGPESTVREQLARFYELAGAAPARPAALEADKKNGNGAGHDEAKGNGAADRAADNPAISQALLEKVFTQNGGNVISLRVLPKGDNRDANAVILILYGYRALRGQDEVPVGDLTTAAARSGVPGVTRIDRLMPASFEQYFSRGGTKRWSRYVLTNPGVTYAEKLVAEMFG